MFDLKLTHRGDLSCSSSPTLSSQKIKFYYGSYAAQIISFNAYSLISNVRSSSQQSIRFMYDDNLENDAIDCLAYINNYAEITQAISMRLKTEIKDIHGLDIGTDYFKYKHFIVKDEKDMHKLQAHILQIAQQIFPEIQVFVHFTDTTNTDYFNSQTIDIKLIFPGNYISSFKL